MIVFQNRILRLAALILRMLLGVFFIFSAVSKLIGIDEFEIYVFSFNVLSLNASFLLARIVIVAEILVGLGLLANMFKRYVDVFAMLMLVAFTAFLCYAAIIGRTDSCHCMGSFLEIDPTQSILKNALLIVVLLFSMGAKPWSWHPRWFVWLPVVVAPIVTVFCLSCPDNWMFGPSEEVYNEEMFDSVIAPEGELYPVGLQQGRHVVAFLTPGCPYCRMADEKLTHICRRNSLDSTAFVYFTPAVDSTVAPLTIDTSSFIRPALLIPGMTYAHITYGQRPMIFLMENGKVTATCHYRNVSEQQIVDFIQQK